MALNPHFRESLRNTALDTVTTALSTSAIFVLYAGAQPANTDAAVTAANTVVASLAFPSTNAFAAAVSGVLTANTITQDASAAGGTAAWFSLQKATGLRIADGSVGTSGADLNLNAVAITTGAAVSVTSFTVTFAA
jgi:hypothetical protein